MNGAEGKGVFLNDLAIRSFRYTADGDYITARFAIRAHLWSQFLWSGLQAIEKYIKCILLLNRVRAPDIGHDLKAGFARLEGVPFCVRISDDSRRFLELLDEYGRHRYFDVPYTVRSDYIFALDKLVWELRRYCQPLGLNSHSGDREIDWLPIDLKRINKFESNPTGFKLMRGELEAILKDKRHPARASLIWMNRYFGTRQREVSVRLSSYSANPTIALHPETLEVALEYIKIPRDVVNAYREEWSRRLESS